MRSPGRLLAAGRDADIYEYGPGLVLRRSRSGRSLQGEARIMEYVRAGGYPAPAVEELSGDGRSMVMERVDGPNMVDAMTRRPWTIARQGGLLADLHRRLHEIAAPDWLGAAPVGTGDRLLHLDLHPLNVLLGARGPVVIDWANACAGDPHVDVAVAWVLMEAGEVPAGQLMGALLGRLRAPLVKSFLASFDRQAVGRCLFDVVTWKVGDPHMSAAEQSRMWQVVEGATGQGPPAPSGGVGDGRSQ